MLLFMFINRSFEIAARQKCSDMIVFAEWKSTYQKHFFRSLHYVNDYGKCCYIVPQLDFESQNADLSG